MTGGEGQVEVSGGGGQGVKGEDRQEVGRNRWRRRQMEVYRYLESSCFMHKYLPCQ